MVFTSFHVKSITSSTLGKRVNRCRKEWGHKFDIRNFKDPDFSTHVATHFNTDDHTLSDFTFMPIDIVPDDKERLLKETYWIHKMGQISKWTKYKIDVQY